MLNDDLSLETKSGDIAVAIRHEAPHEKRYLSARPPNTQANLSTITTSGEQRLQIRHGLNGLYWAGILGLGYPYLLNSTHYSHTGSISLRTTDMWEGKVHATSVNGSIDLRGGEVELLSDPVDGIPFGKDSKHVWAKKGSYDGKTIIETANGNISFCADHYFGCELKYGMLK